MNTSVASKSMLLSAEHPREFHHEHRPAPVVIGARRDDVRVGPAASPRLAPSGLGGLPAAAPLRGRATGARRVGAPPRLATLTGGSGALPSASGVQPGLPGRPQVQRIVMAADVDPPRRLARKNRDDVAQFGLLRHAAPGRKHVRIEAHLQLRARALELVQNPLPRRADAVRRDRDPKGIAGLERRELPQELLEPFRRNRRDEFLDARVELGPGRGSWAAS